MEHPPSTGSGPLAPDESVFAHITHPKKRLFLEAYAACGSVRQSAHIAQSAASQNAFWLHTDPEYAEAFAVAQRLSVQALADEAMRRAQGWEDEQVQADGSVKRLFKYSDTMLIFMMKARDPDTYFPELKARYQRDRASDVSELLKAVLLELTERHTIQAPATEADWAPLPPRTANGPRSALPVPPSPDEA